MAPTPAPAGLRAAGRALWDSISDPEVAWKLNPAERAVLARACRTADRCAELDAQYDHLVNAGRALEPGESALLSRGSMGQEVEHPVLVALAKHDALLQRLIGSLKLPDLESGEKPVSSSAREAANARWSQPRVG